MLLIVNNSFLTNHLVDKFLKFHLQDRLLVLFRSSAFLVDSFLSRFDRSLKKQNK